MHYIGRYMDGQPLPDLTSLQFSDGFANSRRLCWRLSTVEPMSECLLYSIESVTEGKKGS